MTYHDTIRTNVESIVDSSPTWQQICATTRQQIRRGVFPRPYVDALAQPYRGSRFDTTDLYILAQLHTATMQGNIVCGQWDVGTEPFKDQEETRNNALLAGLSDWSPLRAHFAPANGANGDGSVRWTQPIILGQLFEVGVPREVTVPPGGATLEVGHTEATTTYFHLQATRRLARWAYGSTKLWIFQLVNDDFWSLPI